MAFKFLFKSSFKLGTIGGCTYYTINKGFWSDAERTIEAHEDLKKQFQKIPFDIKYVEIPYLKEIPFDRIQQKQTFVEYWNWGVRSFFCGVNCLPRVAAKYSQIGWDKLTETLK